MEFFIFQFVLVALNAAEISLGMIFIIIYITFPVCAFLFSTVVKPASGKIKRLNYFGFWLLITILTYSIMMALQPRADSQELGLLYKIFFVSVVILMVLSHWMGKLAARRARDAGKSPRFGAIAIIPIVGFMLFFLPSRGGYTSDEMQKVFE